MRIQHIRSGQEETITKEQWDLIVKNGFQSDFKVLDNLKPSAEVTKALKDAKEEKES
jgi:hypothetical protein